MYSDLSNQVCYIICTKVYNLTYNKQSQFAMISSLSVCLRQRTKDQVTELLTMAYMIPCMPEHKFNRQKVLERLLNIEQGDYNKVKEREKLLRLLNKKFQEGLIRQEDNTDPVRHLLIRAILANQSWGDIITKNRWEKLFIKNLAVWGHYEQWIVFLCFQGFQRDKAKFLSSNLIKRSSKIMVSKSYGFKTSYYQNKYKKWISKDIDQLKQIHYQIERNLIISLKLGLSFQQTAERLNLQQIMLSSVNPFENDRNDWILFLCTKFEDNYPMKKLEFNTEKQNFVWVQHKINIGYKTNDFQAKLNLILNKYKNFDRYFTNQIQASLLSDIQQRNSWKTAESHINDLFSMNVKVQNKKSIQYSQKIQRVSQDQNDQNLNTANIICKDQLPVQKYQDSYSNAKQSINSEYNCQQPFLISSIPILLYERSREKIRDIFLIASIIEYKTEAQKFIRQKFLQRVLNIDSTYKFKETKQQQKAHRNMLKQQILQTKGSVDEIIDPTERFLTKAIIQKQSWANLIVKNKWVNIFYTNHDSWSLYELWIIFLCFQGFDTQKGKFLAAALTKRSNSVIKLQLTGFKTSYYLRKFKKWISKDVSQFELIHYQIERNLLISIKLAQNIFQVVERLNLKQALESSAIPIQNQRNDWILFLCTQFQDNYSIKKPQFNRHTQKIQWTDSQTTVLYKLNQYQKKLQSILCKYHNFQLFFTNEIEASLLSDIKQKNSWKVAQNHINQLFQYNKVHQSAKLPCDYRNFKIQADIRYQQGQAQQSIVENNTNMHMHMQKSNIIKNYANINFQKKTEQNQNIICKQQQTPQPSQKYNKISQYKQTNNILNKSLAIKSQIDDIDRKASQNVVFPSPKCQKLQSIRIGNSQARQTTKNHGQTNSSYLHADKYSQPGYQSYQSFLKEYNNNPSIIKKMSSEQIKDMLKITLLSRSQNKDTLAMEHSIQECSEDDSSMQEIQQDDLNKSFFAGFDELATRVVSKQTTKTKLK